jgi:TLD
MPRRRWGYRWWQCCGSDRACNDPQQQHSTTIGADGRSLRNGCDHPNNNNNHDIHDEDDLQAVRSWRQQRNTSSQQQPTLPATSTALVVATTNNSHIASLQRIDEDPEYSRDYSASPIQQIEEIEEIPSSPTASFQQLVERSPISSDVLVVDTDGDDTSQREQPYSQTTITAAHFDDVKVPNSNPAVANNNEQVSHFNGGFPTFTREEEEWRQQQLLQDGYLSSSSSSSSTVEDPVLRQSPVAVGDDTDEKYAIGPIDLDELQDDLDDLNTSTISKRPEPDDGDSPPETSFQKIGFINQGSKDYPIDEFTDITTIEKMVLKDAVPDLNTELFSINNSAESEELDAMVAAIDHELDDESTTLVPSFSNSVNGPSQNSQFVPSVKSITSQNSSNSTPIKIRPSRRDSPSVYDPSSYVAIGDNGTEEEGGQVAAIISPSSFGSDGGNSSRGRSAPAVIIPETAQHRRTARSRSRGRKFSSSIKNPHRPNTIGQQSTTTSTPQDSHLQPSIPLHNEVVNSVEYSSPLRTFDMEEDRLSDIPSEVDPELKERYLKACRILKMSLLEKDATLSPSGKMFLTQLMLQMTPSEEDFLTEEKVQQFEYSAKSLRSSPLFDTTTSIVSADFSNTAFEERNSNETNMMSNPYTPTTFNTSVSTESTGVTEQELHIHNQSNVHSFREKKTSAMSQVSSSLFSRVDDDYPYRVIGTEDGYRPNVLTPRLMGALRGFLPYDIGDHNFWLKFALEREQDDDINLASLLSKIPSCQHTVFSVETLDGYVFGAFCSSPWSVQTNWFGSDESFLWRLKHPRTTKDRKINGNDGDSEIEIYPYTGADNLIQYCTTQTIAVGGGTDWTNTIEGCPYTEEPSGIGFLLDGDLMGGETSSCVTFANPRLGNRLLGGANEFDVQSLEVWTMTPCATAQDAEENEIQRQSIQLVEANKNTSSDF